MPLFPPNLRSFVLPIDNESGVYILVYEYLVQYIL